MALPGWYARVKGIFAAQGVSPRVWLAIMAPESSGDPTARNLGTPGHPEDSVGLFAVNRLGGQGQGYSVQQLQDPIINAGIAVHAIAAAQETCKRKGKGGEIDCIAAYSGHPVETGVIPSGNQLIANIKRAYAHIDPLAFDEAQYTQAVGAGPAPGGGGGGGGEGSPVTSFWDSFVSGFIGAFRGPTAAVPSNEGLVWGLVFGGTGLGLIWLGLGGLVAPGVRAVAQTVAPVLPAARGVAAAAGAVSSATNAVGGTTVKAVNAISPKVPKGTQAVRVKGAAPAAPRGKLPQPPLKAGGKNSKDYSIQFTVGDKKAP